MTDYFKYVNDREENNVRLTQESFLEDIKKFELSVNILYHTLSEIHTSFKGRELKPENKSATVMLSYRFLVSSKCFFNIVKSGYYFEAQILLRTMQENMFYSWSFANSNDNARKWYTKKLRLRDVKKTLDFKSNPQYNEAYGTLCDFVHPNMLGINRFTDFLGEQQIGLSDSPKFKEEGKQLLRAFRMLNTSVLIILKDLFNEDLDKKTIEVVNLFVIEEQKEIKSQNNLAKLSDAKT